MTGKGELWPSKEEKTMILSPLFCDGLGLLTAELLVSSSVHEKGNKRHLYPGNVCVNR